MRVVKKLLIGLGVFFLVVIAFFAWVGAVHDLELRSYYANNIGRTGNFSFKGTFENGEALVNVTIVKKDRAVRVLGFHLEATHMRDGVSKLQT